jgi:hypothetical protein
MMPVTKYRHLESRYVVFSATERVQVITGGVRGMSEGGHFVYDEATLLSLIDQWVELANHYRGSLERTGLGAVDAPGLDFASEGVAKSANNSGTGYLRYLEQNHDYCIEQARLLRNTLDDYLGAEHRSVTDLEQTQPGT